jgi:hypothetical protein
MRLEYQPSSESPHMSVLFTSFRRTMLLLRIVSLSLSLSLNKGLSLSPEFQTRVFTICHSDFVVQSRQLWTRCAPCCCSGPFGRPCPPAPRPLTLSPTRVSHFGFRGFGPRVSGFEISCCGFRVSCFGFRDFVQRVSGFGFRGWGFGLCGSRFRGLPPGAAAAGGFGSMVHGFGFRISGLGFRFSVFGFRVSGFGFRERCPPSQTSGVERLKAQVQPLLQGHLAHQKQTSPLGLP